MLFTSELKMEAARSSETLASNHHTTRRNNSENHRHEDLKFRNPRTIVSEAEICSRRDDAGKNLSVIIGNCH
jgi:hypothetical protein